MAKASSKSFNPYKERKAFARIGKGRKGRRAMLFWQSRFAFSSGSVKRGKTGGKRARRERSSVRSGIDDGTLPGTVGIRDNCS